MILSLAIGVAVGLLLGILATYTLGVFLLLTRGLPQPSETRTPIARIKQPDGGWR